MSRNNIENQVATISIVLLYCDLRTGKFGMGTHSNQLIEYFKSKEGFNVTVVKTDCKSVKAVKSSFEQGVEVIQIPMPQNRVYLSGENNEYQLRYAKRISEIIYPYIFNKANTIILANTVDHLNLFRILKDILEAKFIYVHHNFTFKYLIRTSYSNFAEHWRKNNIPYHPVAFEYTRYQKEMADISEHVVTVTRQAEDFFCDVLDISKSKISTIYNGLNFSSKELRTDVPDIRRRLRLREEEKVILFCGRIVEEKGISYLIDAIKFLSQVRDDFRLIVIGDGNISDLLTRSHPYWYNVIVTGALPPETIGDLYAIADIGVMPSLQEQCSFTAIEMRVNRVPLIVSSVEGLDETFEDGVDALKLSTFYDENGLIYLSGQEFASKICKLFDDPDLRKTLAENAFTRGIAHFSRQEMFDKYEALFQLLTQTGKSVAPQLNF
jgi:glycosyltransferase involved in cell wall biosynthesis